VSFVKYLNPATTLRHLMKVWRTPHVLPSELATRDAMNRSVARGLLAERYPELLQPDSNPLAPFELKVFSMNGEDGILLHLLSKVGTSSRRFVEFGIGDGRECNTAILSLHLGWSGLLMDIGAGDVAKARKFYRDEGAGDRVRIECHAITAENLDPLLTQYGMSDIDVISIDIDGNDYWVWKSMKAARPRIAILEYNPSFGADRAVTIPYQPTFSRFRGHQSGNYHGASLMALTKLGTSMGYELVGCDSSGSNAFFVRNDLMAPAKLKAIAPEQAFMPSTTRLRKWSEAEQWESIKHLPLVEV
jgi:hypothetical protein